MTRPAPRIRSDEIIAAVTLEPSGAHELEVTVPSGVVGMRFNAGQVAQLEKAIAEYRAHVTRADGGPDFFNRKTIHLEVS